MRILSFALFFAVFTLAGFQVSAADPAKDLSIIRVTPAGEDVSGTRQIVIEFNRAVVPLGRMDRDAEELGITISPPIQCQWRWLNTTSLACNLDETGSLIPATSYDLTITPKITAEDGAMIAEKFQHSFITQRPALDRAYFKTWRGPSTPVIRAAFTQAVSKSSVAAHIYIEENTPAKTRYELSVHADEDDQEAPETIAATGEEARRIWLIEPVKELPVETAMSLRVEPGLQSASGSITGVENRDAVNFYTFPAFTFKGVQCTNNQGESVLIAPDKPQTEKQLCDPMRGASLAFSTPVLRSEVKDNVVLTPDLAGGRKDYNPWGDENRDWSRLGDPHQKDALYAIGLPIGLKAAQEYKLEVPGKTLNFFQKIARLFKKDKTQLSSLDDEFGRSLPAFSMSFSTNHRNPNFEIVHHDAVLEKGIDSEVPLYVNNLENFTFDYRSVSNAGDKSGQSRTQDVPFVQDVQFAVPMNIREMLAGATGAVYGMVKTTPEVNKTSGERRLFAQVSPWQVHVKLGHFESIAWVVDFSTGKPVSGVSISVFISTFKDLSSGKKSLVSAVTDENGIAVFAGTDQLDPDQVLLRSWQDDDLHLFAKASKGSDMALLPLVNDFEIGTWRISDDVYARTREKDGHMMAWGMTAQGVYRAGDTMQYKLYVRGQDNESLVPPPNAQYKLEIRDPKDKVVQTIDNIKLNQFGSYAGEYALPKSATLGWYDFHLTATFPGRKNAEGNDVVQTFYPLRVLVSDFTPSPFRVTTELNGDHFKAGDKVEISAAAKMHSGGAYGDATIRSTITLKSRWFQSKDPAAKDFSFNSYTGNYDSEQLSQKEATLNDKGEWEDNFELPEKGIVYGVLEIESAVRDDRGKSIASLAQADYVGVDRLVGLKLPQWVFESKKTATIKAIVVDDHGKPVEGTDIKIRIEREDIQTAKVKGAGNAYLSDITREWVEAGSCALTSSLEAQDCIFTPNIAGTYRAVATVQDTKGRTHQSETTLWVSGDDYVQWDNQGDLALTIKPEQAEYKVGDKARYLVKNPYPGATALISVERYGVIESWVQTFEDSTPVVEFEVKPDYLPGFYLSVMVMSPRVEPPPEKVAGAEFQIDMGKPAFRMGYVKVPVRDPYKEMKVEVAVAQEVYRPRDVVTLTLNATPRHEPDTKEPVELAVAVLDESVFDLIAAGKKAYDPYEGFYDLDSLDVSNFSLLSRLVGRQKFEKKGANPGGDGGADVGMRTIFKYVSYWNPSVPVDEAGNATINFEAPDNLTGWRVLALATTPSDRMGLGEGTFKVNRPTEMRPVMPNQVREGDAFEAGFSVMNRTDRKRTLRVSITAQGDLKGEKQQTKTEEIELDPYKRATLHFKLEAALLPIDRALDEGKISFSATAGDIEDSDGLEHTIPVLKSRTVETAATYGMMVENTAKENIDLPKGIYTDTGDVSVVLSPSVIANLDGAFKYIRDYPYTCWEQRLTRGVMASHYQNLKSYLKGDFTWPESDKIPQQTLEEAAEFQAPNGGMTYFVATDDHADPYLSAYTALAFTWLKASGYTIPSDVEKKLHDYLLTFLRENTAPDFYQDGMRSTVRAVALAALSKEGKIGKDEIVRFEPHVKGMSLFGKAHFLQAALAFKGTDDIARKTADMILSSGVESGGKFSFNETYDDGYDRILATPLRDNCAVLDAFLLYNDKQLVNDKPFKMVRMITQSREKRDHWENTQENMFCLNALASYARSYETDDPDMEVSASLDGKEFGSGEFEDKTDEPVTFTRPIEKDDPGKTSVLQIARDGVGRLYYAARLRYAPKDGQDKDVNAGIDIKREYSVRDGDTWVLLDPSKSIKRGDVVRVDLYVSLPTARNFVVVDDPLPGGLETVNRDLATASSVDDAAAIYDQSGGSWWFKFGDWTEYNASFWSFYHREMRHDAVRFYADWLPPGNYHLSYAAQAIADGTFAALPTRAEEMYDPDVYGRGVSGELIVDSTP